jgi:hypothetical protein
MALLSGACSEPTTEGDAPIQLAWGAVSWIPDSSREVGRQELFGQLGTIRSAALHVSRAGGGDMKTVAFTTLLAFAFLPGSPLVAQDIPVDSEVVHPYQRVTVPDLAVVTATNRHEFQPSSRGEGRVGYYPQRFKSKVRP